MPTRLPTCPREMIQSMETLQRARALRRHPFISPLVTLSAPQVAALKALASAFPSTPSSQAGRRSDISTNDAVAGLVWTLMTHLRGRPLPGRAAPGTGAGHCMGLAVDLRRNGLRGVLPLNLFANATWCLHIPSTSSDNATAAEDKGRVFQAAMHDLRSNGADGVEKNPSACLAEGRQPIEASSFVQALRCGARQVRDSLVDFRCQAPSSGRGVVELAADQCRGPLSAQVGVSGPLMDHSWELK